MTFTEAAAEVLRLVGRPLHYKEITDLAIEKNLLSHVGKSPEVTMGARLAALLKKSAKDNPLVRVKPGVFALREWDEATIQSGLSEKGTAQRTGDSASTETSEAPSEPSPAEAAPAEEEEEAALPADWEEEEAEPPPPDEVERAEIAAAGAELFDEEDDDDRPILGPDAPPAAGGGEGASQRRRRRRRRRGRASTEGAAFSGGNLPSYTVTPAFPEGSQPVVTAPPAPELPGRPPSAPEITSNGESQQPLLDDLAGRDLADAVAFLLNTLDRNGGQVAIRQLAENAQRRGRIAGEISQVQAQISAAIRADNARRSANGQRVRFRFSGGKVALTDWLLGGELARLEAEAQAAVERYREASRRAFLRKIQELPGHALVELTLLVLERAGIGQIRAVRRPGMPGGESHFSAIQKSVSGEAKLALVIRRDGREIGRERVADLRGSLHHYGPALSGLLVTTGQVLSGAREECAALGASPVGVCDGMGLARLCEEHDVAVVRARLPIALPDVDMLEALRAT